MKKDGSEHNSWHWKWHQENPGDTGGCLCNCDPCLKLKGQQPPDKYPDTGESGATYDLEHR